MNISSERACYLLMCSALNNGTQTVSFTNPRDARSWRHACYKMRRFLKAANNNKFERLRFKISAETELIVERKDEV